MKIRELAEKLNLKVVSGFEGLNNEISGGYTSDLLSDVIGNAESGAVWITLQTHKNVLAIASLKDLAGIIVVKNLIPEADLIEQSNEENIPVMVTSESTFSISGKLFNLLN
jgi:serine kinase of HPr protein (carbohydrate metabolism regulator)